MTAVVVVLIIIVGICYAACIAAGRADDDTNCR